MHDGCQTCATTLNLNAVPSLVDVASKVIGLLEPETGLFVIAGTLYTR
jgi:hypothetical protein